MVFESLSPLSKGFVGARGPTSNVGHHLGFGVECDHQSEIVGADRPEIQAIGRQRWELCDHDDNAPTVELTTTSGAKPDHSTGTELDLTSSHRLGLGSGQPTMKDIE